MENPKEVLEIGTYMGHTTRRIAENLPDSVTHTVDLPSDYSTAQTNAGLPPKDDFHLIKHRVAGREFKGQNCEKRIVQHFGDTAVVDFKEFGHPTFFFIDGSHTYEYCKQDTEKCFALSGGKGVFCGTIAITGTRKSSALSVNGGLPEKISCGLKELAWPIGKHRVRRT